MTKSEGIWEEKHYMVGVTNLSIWEKKKVESGCESCLLVKNYEHVRDHICPLNRQFYQIVFI
jgi:hypothetical protein